MLLQRACRNDLSLNQLRCVTRSVLQNMWRLLLTEHLIFTRSHVVMLYERLNALLVFWSSPTPSPQQSPQPPATTPFRELIITLAKVYKPFRNTRHPPQVRAYRLSCLRKIHRVLMTTLFKHLSHRGHYADLDTLFEFNCRDVLPSFRQWLPSLDANDAQTVWTTCTSIRNYCQTNAIRLHTLLHQSPAIWALCQPQLNQALFQLSICPLPEMMQYIHTHLQTMMFATTSIHTLLRSFTSKQQRRILFAMMWWMCHQSTADIAPVHTDTPPVPDEDEDDDNDDAGVSSAGVSSGGVVPVCSCPETVGKLYQDVREAMKTADGDAKASEYDEHSGAALSTTPFSAPTYTLLCHYFKNHMRSVLRITKSAPYVVLYYLRQSEPNTASYTHYRTFLFTLVCPLLNTTPISLSRWVSVCEEIPLGVFRALTAKTHETLTRYKTHNYETLMDGLQNGSIAIHSKTLQMCQALRQFDRTVARLLDYPIDMNTTVHNPNASHHNAKDIAALVDILHRFITHHKLMVETRRVPGIVQLVKCALLLYDLEWLTPTVHTSETGSPAPDADGYYTTYISSTSTPSASSTPSISSASSNCTCAICYNAVNAPFKRLRCGHVFHTECLFRTVQLATLPSPSPNACVCKCPYCMQPIAPPPDILLTPDVAVANTSTNTHITSIVDNHRAYKALYRWWNQREYELWLAQSGQVSDPEESVSSSSSSESEEEVETVAPTPSSSSS